VSEFKYLSRVINSCMSDDDVRKYLFSCRIVDVWNSLSDTVVKSTSVASFKNNLSAVDVSRFLTVV